jgi:hypothetical protein
MALRRKALISLAVSIISGSSVLVLHTRGADLWGLPIVAHIPDPLPLPCRSQNSANADRICLSWTAPRDNTSHTIAVATN